MKHLVIFRPQTRSGLALLAFAVVAVVFAICTQRTYGYDQDIAKLNRFVQTTKANTASMQIFREGREISRVSGVRSAADIEALVAPPDVHVGRR